MTFWSFSCKNNGFDKIWRRNFFNLTKKRYRKKKKEVKAENIVLGTKLKNRPTLNIDDVTIVAGAPLIVIRTDAEVQSDDEGFGVYAEFNAPFAKYDTKTLSSAELLHNQFTVNFGAVFNLDTLPFGRKTYF